MSGQFKSLEDIGQAFKQADDVENESLFVKGRVIKRATEQGFDIDETIGYCATMTTLDKRTIYRYYSTARTFSGRMYGLRHEMHAIAADTIDYRKDMTPEELQQAQENALEWLKIASKEQYSTRALRAAIKAAGGRVDVKPLVLLDGVAATVIEDPLDGALEIVRLYLKDLLHHPIPPGTEVKVTLVVATPVAEKVES